MTRVSIVKASNVFMVENRGNNNQTPAIVAIELEKIDTVFKSARRTKNFKNILWNTPTNKFSLKYIFFGFTDIGLSLILTSFFAHIPIHNTIENRKKSNFFTRIFFNIIKKQ